MKDNLIDDLFGTKPLKINTEDDSYEINEFRPKYKNGTNDVYNAIIRFIPNYKDVRNKSIIQKYTVYLKDPTTNTGRYIDDPTSIGEKSVLSQMYFALKDGNSIAKDLSKNWTRHQEYVSLVQVIEDVHEPKLVGKILVWRYGKKIHEKILDEMTSVSPDIPGGNPFDLFSGKLFLVKVTEQNKFNNFDKSKFIENVEYPKNCMRIKTVDKNKKDLFIIADRNVASKTMEHDKVDGKKFIMDYLIKNSPDLSKYEYHPWDEDTRNYVQKEITLAQNILQGKVVSNPQSIASVDAIPGVNSGISLDSVLSSGNNTPAYQSPVQSPEPSVTQPVPPSIITGTEDIGTVDTQTMQHSVSEPSNDKVKDDNMDANMDEILSNLMS